MRPVKLTMQAFGSYGKRTVIDFEKTNPESVSDYRRYRRRKEYGF